MSTPLEIYNNLMKLVETNEAFYYTDQGSYRVFNYRLASYTDFLAPDALEARGIMYYLEPGRDPVLVCRPFKKFFNLNENPFTMDLDLEKIEKDAFKEDGSIITSYIDQPTGELMLKSKTSLVSEQAVMANNWIQHWDQYGLYEETAGLTHSGFTVIFELVSPMNRIVLEYLYTKLKVLGVRNNETGELVEQAELKKDFPILTSHWVAEYNWTEQSPSRIEFIKNIEKMSGIEGFVLTFEGGLMAKQKTNWYKSLHFLKDSVSSERRLFEAIIDETVDDVKAMFSTDKFTIQRIEAMENKVIPKYNSIVNKVVNFYGENKELPRKDYAIKGQSELPDLFSLVMGKYTGKGPTFQDFSKKYYKEIYQINDASGVVDNEG